MAASKGTMLIADNAKTVALGSDGVALASGLPLGLGWFIRRRLGLDASDILDRKLGFGCNCCHVRIMTTARRSSSVYIDEDLRAH